MRYRYRSDEELKDSGVEWLGKIPKDWNTPKISSIIETLTDYVANGSFESLAKNVNYLSEEDYAILIRTQDNSNGFKGPFVYIDEKAYNFLSKSKVYPNDIIISNVGAVGNVFKAPNLNKPMSLAPNSILIRTTQNNQYIYYLLQSSFIQEEIRNIVSSTAQPKFNKTNFRGIKTITPKEVEQEKIANFLDEKTSQFDLIISKKEKLIERLEEAKKSLISEVVTGKVKVVKTDGGYELVKRSSEEMKDSGVEWFGEIPKDWELKKFSHVIKISNGQVDPKIMPYSEMILIAPNHIKSGMGKVINLETANYQGADSGKYLCDKGDVIYSKIRPNLCKACIAPIDCLCSADMYPMKTDYKVLNQEYLLWILLSDNFTRYAVLESDRVAMPKVNRECLAKFKVPIPSIEEQILLNNILKQNDKFIDNLINKAKLQIEKLKEAKQSLISEAVTGKIEILD